MSPKVHLKIKVISNSPTVKAYYFTACNRSLESPCQKLLADYDPRMVTCSRCKLSREYYQRVENLNHV